VTLLARSVAEPDESALLGSGVEVVQTARRLRWLVGRAGHYSHVVWPEDGGSRLLRAALRWTQRRARFVDMDELETVADVPASSL
jgi:hypothetical protein